MKKTKYIMIYETFERNLKETGKGMKRVVIPQEGRDVWQDFEQHLLLSQSAQNPRLIQL